MINAKASDRDDGDRALDPRHHLSRLKGVDGLLNELGGSGHDLYHYLWRKRMARAVRG